MQLFSKMKNNYKDAQKGKSFSYVFTAVLGLGFFTTAITWAMFNIYVPRYLDNLLNFKGEKTLIGVIMVLDNIAAITLQPWLGNVSDNIWTKWGRRMPFIIIGIPIAAIFFGLLSTFQEMFILLLVAIGGFNIAMALYRAPVVALMPDLVPKEFRSRGNAVINLLGGVGALIGLFVMSAVYKVNPNLSFWIVSVIMLLCLVALILTIKETKKRVDVEVKEKVKLFEAIKEIFTSKDKSLLFILLAISSWFFAFNALETWFSTYAAYHLNMAVADASMLLGILSLTFILAAIPAGLMAKKIDRRKIIIMGIIGLSIVLIPIVFFSLFPISVLQEFITFLPFKWTWEIIIVGMMLFLGGIFWAMINVNSIVIVWEMAGTKKLGTLTGLYYFFVATAAILSPVIAGALWDLIGVKYLFLYSIVFLTIALVFMLFVKTTGKEGKASSREVNG